MEVGMRKGEFRNSEVGMRKGEKKEGEKMRRWEGENYKFGKGKTGRLGHGAEGPSSLFELRRGTQKTESRGKVWLLVIR